MTCVFTIENTSFLCFLPINFILDIGNLKKINLAETILLNYMNNKTYHCTLVKFGKLKKKTLFF